MRVYGHGEPKYQTGLVRYQVKVLRCTFEFLAVVCDEVELTAHHQTLAMVTTVRDEGGVQRPVSLDLVETADLLFLQV